MGYTKISPAKNPLSVENHNLSVRIPVIKYLNSKGLNKNKAGYTAGQSRMVGQEQ